MGLKLKEDASLARPDRLYEELLSQLAREQADDRLKEILEVFWKKAADSLAADLRPLPGSADEELPELLGHSPALRRLKETILQVAPSSSTVLILGVQGPGKEV